MSIEAVAREAGCSRSSIYRRHSSREGLILEATLVRFGPGQSGAVDRGSLEAVVESRAASFRESAFVLALTVLMDERIRGTELGGRYFEEAYLPIRQERAEFLLQAVANGEIRPEADIDLLLDAISGTLLFRMAHRPEFEPDLPDRLTSLLLNGVGRDRS